MHQRGRAWVARAERRAAASTPRGESVKKLPTDNSGRLVGRLGFKPADVLQQFFDRGQAAEVELQHLPGSLGRFLASPKADEQAGDDGQVDLDGDAVLAGGQQVLTTQDALEPTEEQFNWVQLVAQHDFTLPPPGLEVDPLTLGHFGHFSGGEESCPGTRPHTFASRR
jgi:hypothetical protein